MEKEKKLRKAIIPKIEIRKAVLKPDYKTLSKDE